VYPAIPAARLPPVQPVTPDAQTINASAERRFPTGLVLNRCIRRGHSAHGEFQYYHVSSEKAERTLVTSQHHTGHPIDHFDIGALGAADRNAFFQFYNIVISKI
jgi:hypothetical protein